MVRVGIRPLVGYGFEAGHRIDLRTLAVLEQDLIDSDLPMKVDVGDLAAMSPAFRALVERCRVLLM